MIELSNTMKSAVMKEITVYGYAKRRRYYDSVVENPNPNANFICLIFLAIIIVFVILILIFKVVDNPLGSYCGIDELEKKWLKYLCLQYNKEQQIRLNKYYQIVAQKNITEVILPYLMKLRKNNPHKNVLRIELEIYDYNCDNNYAYISGYSLDTTFYVYPNIPKEEKIGIWANIFKLIPQYGINPKWSPNTGYYLEWKKS